VQVGQVRVDRELGTLELVQQAGPEEVDQVRVVLVPEELQVDRELGLV
jgi:hypothetical protein